jgi:hypothetical protein
MPGIIQKKKKEAAVQKTALSALLILLLLMTSWTNMGSWTDGYRTLLTSKNRVDARLFLEKYLSLNEPELKPEAFHFGLIGFEALLLKGLIANDSLLTIIDFSLPSSKDRFFVINLFNNQVIYKCLVSHGRNSGDLYANRFSNKMQSHESALGFFITGKSYQGGQGYSLQLQGVDTGYNERSRVRGIVIHPADYATQEYVTRYGRLGRSFGCPALPPELSRPIINLIKDGSVLFSYYPDQAYIKHSTILNSNQTGVMDHIPM